MIGTGNIAPRHIEAIKALENAELKAIMSHDHTRAVEFASKYGIRRAYSNIDELLKDNDINVVDIVSYHDRHVEYALKAIKAGKHVIVEKPIGIDLDGIDRLVEESKRNDAKLTVISQHRLDRGLIKARERINSGELGKILFVNLDMINKRHESYYNSQKWRKTWKEAGGGVMMMNAVHYIDVLLWMFGDVKSVYGKIENVKHTIEVEDTASALLRFKNNVMASIHASNSADYNNPFRIMIYGSRKSLLVEGNNLVEIANPGSWYSLAGKIKNAAISRLPVKISKSTRYQPGSIAEQLKMFVDGIVNNKQVELPNAEDGKKAVEVVLAIYKSSKSGKEILINK